MGRVAALVAGLVVCHLSLRVALGLEREAPDLFLIAVLIGSRYLSLRAGAALGFVVGLLEDAFSVLSFGATVFAMTVLGTAGAQSRHFFVGNSRWFPLAYFGLGKVLRDLLAWVVSDPATRDGFTDQLLTASPLAALYAAAVGAAVSWLFLRGSLRT